MYSIQKYKRKGECELEGQNNNWLTKMPSPDDQVKMLLRWSGELGWGLKIEDIPVCPAAESVQLNKGEPNILVLVPYFETAQQTMERLWRAAVELLGCANRNSFDVAIWHASEDKNASRSSDDSISEESLCFCLPGSHIFSPDTSHVGVMWETITPSDLWAIPGRRTYEDGFEKKFLCGSNPGASVLALAAYCPDWVKSLEFAVWLMGAQVVKDQERVYAYQIGYVDASIQIKLCYATSYAE